MPRARDARSERDDAVGVALLLELEQLDALEPAPTREALGVAGDLLLLRDLVPPVLFASGVQELVRGRALVEAARASGVRELAAIDLSEFPDRRARYVAAWDDLETCLTDQRGLLDVTAALARRAAWSVRAAAASLPPSTRRRRAGP